jgi:hypothetical protein
LAAESGVDTRGDEQIPGGYLQTKLSSAAPFPIQVSGSSATFKSVKQGVKFTIDVTTDRTEFKKKLQQDGKPGTKELEYWHVIYDGHSRYGRGTCFGTDDSKGEKWENSSTPASGPDGLYRMGYPFVGVPVLDILHHGYTTDLVSVNVDAPKSDREYKGRLHGKTLSDIKDETNRYITHMINTRNWGALDMSEPELRDCRSSIDTLDSHLRIVGARVDLVHIGDALRPDDQFWGYHSGEGPAVLLQAGWEGTVTNPLDLGATELNCRCFCHLGCESFMHYRKLLRFIKNWRKNGDRDRFAYFTNDLSVSITGPFWLYYLFKYDKFNAGKPWEPSLEYARRMANAKIKSWCYKANREHPDDPTKPYEIW